MEFCQSGNVGTLISEHVPYLKIPTEDSTVEELQAYITAGWSKPRDFWRL